jgi:uncharacterized protein YyaL (SSP411 family)
MGSYCFPTTFDAFRPVLRPLVLGITIALASCAEQPDEPALPPVDPVAVTRPWTDPDTSVSWQAWGPSLFAAARERQLPILLYVSGPGCGGLFAGDGLAPWQAQTRFLPTRVDPDRRPDLTRRFAPAGCPSISILDDSGREMVRATDIPVANVAILLTRVHDHLRKRPEALIGVSPGGSDVSRRVEVLSVDAVFRAVAADYDVIDGGFGGPHKFPEPLVLAFLQAYGQRRPESAAAQMTSRSLDAILAGSLWTENGVLAHSYTPDWASPHPSMDGATQAGLLSVLAAAPAASFRHAAQRLFDVVQERWYDSERGVFTTRQVPVAGHGWWSDDPVCSGDNFLLLRAVLGTGDSVGRRGQGRQMAERAGEYLLRHHLDDDGRVRHCDVPESAAGLLRDQMLATLAYGDLARRTGRADFADAARTALQWADRHLWDEETGSYHDAPRPEAPSSWVPHFVAADDRRPAGLALAALALEGQGYRDKARRLLAQTAVSSPGRQHATAALALLALESRPEADE